jgi:hypothetical protein
MKICFNTRRPNEHQSLLLVRFHEAVLLHLGNPFAAEEQEDLCRRKTKTSAAWPHKMFR